MTLTVAAWAAAAAWLWQTQTPSLELPRLDERTLFDRAFLERSADYRTLTRILWALSQATQLAALVLVAVAARRLAALLRPCLGGDARCGAALGLVAALAAWLAALPVGAAAHWWARRYGQSAQGYDGWLADRALGLLVTAAVVTLAAAGAVALAGRLRRDWWPAGWGALALLAFVFVLLQPLVVQPLFNRFEPLADRALAADVQQLAVRAGVALDGVDVSDQSRRTVAPNASVTGIGPSRRVVVDDTLIEGEGFAREEVLAVVAHELAHVARGHVWKAVAWFALIALPATWLVAAVLRRHFERGAADPAAVPLGLLLALAVFLATLPLSNAISRRYEAEADWVGLQIGGDPAAVERLQLALARGALADPTPPGWSRLLLGTHPTALQRVAMARAASVP